MALDPAANVSLCADLLRGGFTTPERVAAFLPDAEAAELAAQLAERRGQVSFPATSNEPVRARLTSLAANALQLRLADPEQLRDGPFAAFEYRQEMVQIAVGLARRWMRQRPNYRPVEEWETDGESTPQPAPAVPRPDPEHDALALETRRRSDLTSCSRGAHAYGEVDPTTGWSTCLSCGHVLVADRRQGPTSLRPNADGLISQPSLPRG